MTKVLRCNDLMPGCTWEGRGSTEAEVLMQAAEHAKAADQSGKIRVEAGVYQSNAHILLRNQEGNPGIGLAIDEKGPILTIHSPDGNVGRLAADNQDIRLGFTDAQADRLILGLSSKGPELLFFDRNQKQRVALASKAAGSLLGMSDAYGNVRAILGEADGKAAVTILGTNGKVIATVPR